MFTVVVLEGLCCVGCGKSGGCCAALAPPEVGRIRAKQPTSGERHCVDAFDEQPAGECAAAAANEDIVDEDDDDDDDEEEDEDDDDDAGEACCVSDAFGENKVPLLWVLLPPTLL